MLVEHLELVDFEIIGKRRSTLRLAPLVSLVKMAKGKPTCRSTCVPVGPDIISPSTLDALIRVSAGQAIIRAQIVDADGRQSLVEVEISRVDAFEFKEPTAPTAHEGSSWHCAYVCL